MEVYCWQKKTDAGGGQETGHLFGVVLWIEITSCAKVPVPC